MLLKVDTSTKWFAKITEAKARIFWLNGRLKFRQLGSNLEKEKWQPAGFPSMLVVFTKGKQDEGI